ncbi:MAG: orotidine 5'-phosphate decarboxylase [Candidatus Micrarchaeota archaeon]|nr:orotidine 5'-phosphate decarboxylase [Candidatus Micrarchaeota archaeon]
MKHKSAQKAEDHKNELIARALEIGAIKLGEFDLKSKRKSPWFFNSGAFTLGKDQSLLAKTYAQAIVEGLGDILNDPEKLKRIKIFGPPQKGITLASSVAQSLAEMGADVPSFHTRPVEKKYGEATGLGTSKEELAKQKVVGAVPQKGDIIIIVDDVITTGGTKVAAIEELKELADDLSFPAIVVAVNRQEVGIDGSDPIESLSKSTGAKVISAVKAIDVQKYLKEESDSPSLSDSADRISTYLRVYGTEEVRKELGRVNQKNIFGADRGIVIAADVRTLEEFEKLVKLTHKIEGIVGYKIGFELGLGFGLGQVMNIARSYTNKPIIYDHQKAGTDIPDTGKAFAEVAKSAGIDSVIFFPQAGSETERAWIYWALVNGLDVMVGGIMTHPAYLESEGGFISGEGALRIYQIALNIGIEKLIVPSTKPDEIKRIREIAEDCGFATRFLSPGLGKQGGDIGKITELLGESWYPIVGREITQSGDIEAAARQQVAKLIRPVASA